MTFDVTGVSMCSRYSFAPNSLHYCGPEKQADLLGYIENDVADNGLVEILNRFETLYPYLVLIASQNHIHDPFDKRVVEAYWLGNSLLKRVSPKMLGDHVADTLALKKKVAKKDFTPMMDHVVGGIPHHNFHVMNIFIRTGHHSAPQTLATMDNCRISWGRVLEDVTEDGVGNESAGGKNYLVRMQPLEYRDGKLFLGSPTTKVTTSITLLPQKGQWVSIHWGYICEVLNSVQQNTLKRYTDFAITYANKKAGI